MKKIILYLAAIVVCLSLAASTLFADKRSENEVKNMIKRVEQILDKYIEAGAEKYAGKELAIIEEYIKKAKVLLEDNDRDEAWYEIGKAEVYFKLIDAKKEFIATEREYNSILNK